MTCKFCNTALYSFGEYSRCMTCKTNYWKDHYSIPATFKGKIWLYMIYKDKTVLGCAKNVRYITINHALNITPENASQKINTILTFS